MIFLSLTVSKMWSPEVATDASILVLAIINIDVVKMEMPQ